MLRWLQKKLPKVATLWAKLCGIAVGAHVTLLFLLFFVYKGNFSDLKLEINANCDKNALVVFMPFQKTVNHKGSGKSSKQDKGSKSTHVKKNVPKPIAPKDKNTQKPQKTPTSLATQSAKSVKKKETKKAKKTKTAVKEKIKKEKPIPEKPIQASKPEEPAKPELIKPPEPEKPEPIIPPMQEDIKPTSTETAKEIDINSDEQNIRYIGQAELDAMCMQEKLISAIAQHWRPPVGVAKNRVCELLIVVDWQGKVKDINVQKNSGSAMYDVSTRTAALAAEYDKQFWGKSFTVTFKPSLR